MNQVSRPLQIVLVVMLGFVCVWYLALRPKTSAAPAVTPPAPAAVDKKPTPENSIAKGQFKAVDKAQATRDEANADAARRSADPGNTAPSAPSASAPSVKRSAAGAEASAASGADRAGRSVTAVPPPTDAEREAGPVRELPSTVMAALDARKVVVLLFWDRRSAEDRAVAKAVAGADRRGGAVVPFLASVKDVSRYSRITSGARVTQSPTVLVIDRQRVAKRLTGYLDRTNVDQAVDSALRAR